MTSKHTRYSLLGILLFATLSMVSCKKDVPKPDPDPDPNPLENYMLIATGTSGELTASLYAEDSLIVGYNRLWVLIRDDKGQNVSTPFNLSFHPLMDMGTMTHACPVEHPLNADTPGVYMGAVVFIMPSGAMGSWMLSLDIEEIGGNPVGSIDWNVNIKTPPQARLLSFEGDINQEKLFVSLVEPRKPQVGINPFEITIHKRETGMSFPAVTEYTVTFDPQMPTMGHGSPNNVQPVHIGDGHYEGKANFTMTGLWRLHLTIKDGTETVKDGISFDVTF
jgi:hypothetical protein